VLERCFDGDSAVDKAIDAYASDRDVRKFFDSLQRLCGAKSEAADAITSAKNDLLRHTLDMMVKQGQISEKGSLATHLLVVF
jgi:hypothetical protein